MEFIKLSTITEKLANILMSVSLVERRVFPLASPESVKMPFICYKRELYTPHDTKQGYDITRIVAYEVIVVAAEYMQSLKTAEAVVARLMSERDIVVENLTETYEDNRFIQIINFKIEDNE